MTFVHFSVSRTKADAHIQVIESFHLISLHWRSGPKHPDQMVKEAARAHNNFGVLPLIWQNDINLSYAMQI